MSTHPKFFPGWKMTTDQHWTYISLCNQVYAALKLTVTKDKEACRKRLHLQAFGPGPDGQAISAKAIDHLKMFDAFKAQALAIIKPDDLNAQLDQAKMEITRLKHAIAKLSPGNNYLRAVMRDKFGAEYWDTLSVEQFTQLRNTLAARQSSRKAKAALVPAGDQSDGQSGSDSDLINTPLQRGDLAPTHAETVSTVSSDPSDNEPF